jgi:serine protease Do
LPGDIILEFNGKPVKNRDELVSVVVLTRPGTTVPVKILRDKQEKTIPLTVDELNLDEEGNRAARATTTDPDDEPLEGFGITLSSLTPELARQLRIPASTEGVVVTDVEQGSSAFRAGIARGDVILQVNRRPVSTAQEANRALAQVPSNGTAFLLVLRNGQETFFTVRKD